MTEPIDTAAVRDGGPLYILLTECLQNDLFLNQACGLCLPDRIVREMLVGKERAQLSSRDAGPITPELMAKGPLGLFLEATVGRRRRRPDESGTLHVINVRDWHLPGASYDQERRLYGRHCEAGTWGAAPIDGLDEYLDPDGAADDDEPKTFHEGSVHIHHVRADAVFDFRPRHDEDKRTHYGKFVQSPLERILDGLIQEHVGAASPRAVYVALIGVYTDIKLQLVLVGLRTRYDLPNLAVSDTLTASRTLERHLAGLDFMDKVLGVEVIHGVNDLACFLGSPPPIKSEDEIVAGISFARYRSYFADKQNVLAYQDERLQEYLALTQQRSLRVYELIRRANVALLIWGSVFLLVTLAASALKLADPGGVDWQLPVATGAIGLIQIVSAFFTRPIRQLQENLTNLAVLRMILESRSLKTAVMRYHITTPETLRELETPELAETASRQIAGLRQQLDVIEKTDGVDYAALASLGFHAEPGVDGQRAAGATAEGRVADAPARSLGADSD
jgi:hypothetical protein